MQVKRYLFYCCVVNHVLKLCFSNQLFAQIGEEVEAINRAKKANSLGKSTSFKEVIVIQPTTINSVQRSASYKDTISLNSTTSELSTLHGTMVLSSLCSLTQSCDRKPTKSTLSHLMQSSSSLCCTTYDPLFDNLSSTVSMPNVHAKNPHDSLQNELNIAHNQAETLTTYSDKRLAKYDLQPLKTTEESLEIAMSPKRKHKSTEESCDSDFSSSESTLSEYSEGIKTPTNNHGNLQEDATIFLYNSSPQEEGVESNHITSPIPRRGGVKRGKQKSGFDIGGTIPSELISPIRVIEKEDHEVPKAEDVKLVKKTFLIIWFILQF